ncbi:hypothetical protein EDC04DRAFT_2598392 [Pisolithus marmoratus]|nr:hypothetical protein EDC04DRAFT_2598392 [Pisolithus marmoratus]
MALAPSAKKGHQHANAQCTGKKSTDQHGAASSKMPVRSSTWALREWSPPRRSPPCNPPPVDHQLEQYEETMPMDDKYLLQDWKNSLELNGIKLGTHDETLEEVPTVHSEPEDKGHCRDDNDHLSICETDAGSKGGGSDNGSDDSDQGDGRDWEAEDDQHSAFGHGTPIEPENDNYIEVDGFLAEEDTGAQHEESGKVHAHRVRAQQLSRVLIDASMCNRIPQPPSQNDLEHHCQFARTPEADHTDIECLSKYKQACICFKSGMIPHYQELYTIVYQDSSNFCSEIKKLCVCNVVSLYNLKPPSKLHEDKSIQWLLYTISVAAYYGTSQKLLGWTLEFKEYLPEAAIVLIMAGIKSVLCSLEQRGKIHDLRTQVEPINQKGHQCRKGLQLQGMRVIQTPTINHWVLGPHHQQQLARWVKFASKTGVGLVAGDEDEYALAPMD